RRGKSRWLFIVLLSSPPSRRSNYMNLPSQDQRPPICLFVDAFIYYLPDETRTTQARRQEDRRFI
uniref:Uncharacterized protein n=1 Tax=Denticeps clupeoides TaxID=299321 RepID=A0A8C4FXP8_9TELE